MGETIKNILLISFALLIVGGCSESSNPLADNTSSVQCTENGCSATGCASDCACGCEGAGGDNCICSTNCTCANVDDDEDDDSSTANVVLLEGFAFSPSTLTISIGETVTWTLNASHTVVSDDFTPVAGSLSTYSHQFDTAGEFNYKCGNHSSMTGTIIVE